MDRRRFDGIPGALSRLQATPEVGGNAYTLMSRQLLILIPAYNEEERIEATLDSLLSYFADHPTLSLRVVVVLNGCRDRTRDVVNGFCERDPRVRLREFEDSIGKGGALIEGLHHWPEADLIGYMDADGSSPPWEIARLAELCGEGDVVIGSRWARGARVIEPQSWIRRRLSRIYHLLVEALFHLGIQDTQCPAKVLSQSVAKRIADQLTIADFAFDVNLLVCANRASATIFETPIEWRDVAGSKVSASLPRACAAMLLSTVRLRMIYSPLSEFLRPLRPMETWIYKRLRTAAPRRRGANKSEPRSE